VSGLSAQLVKQLSLKRRKGRELICSTNEIERVSDAHALKRAWEQMSLDGILLVEGKPTVYLKEVSQLRQSDIRRYQRFIWNQGMATILICATPTDIHIYSGLAKPTPDDEEFKKSTCLVEILNRASQALEVSLLVRRIETGQIYVDHPQSFDRESAVDQYLLRNLREAAQQLHAIRPALPYTTIHSLLGRAIFICYLVDRKIINQEQFIGVGAKDASTLSDLFERYESQSAKNALYGLFEQLQSDFNGSMFDDDFTGEKTLINDKHIDVLRRFFRGDDLDKQQPTLGFWAYDFNFIPIETISAIYEKLLTLEDEQLPITNYTKKRRSGVYYTPKHLAEVVIDMATESWSSLLGKAFLDPACGSGTFVVTIFNRVAEEWKRKNPDKRSPTRWRALVKILKENIFGCDKDLMACRLTCFSLYLALLDHFEPRDIQQLASKGRLLPDLLLVHDETAPDGDSRTILYRNFFEENLPLPTDGLDLIIGNPPWVGRKQPKDKVANNWYKTNVGGNMPSDQVAHAFMWKCSKHLKEDGITCLLLPSKVFLNRTDEFQKKWLLAHDLDEVLQLSDMRYLLFEDAICPAMAIKYKISSPGQERQPIQYIVPKASRNDPRRGIVIVTPSDYKELSFFELIDYASHSEIPKLWKMYMRGTPRDIRFIERLSSLPRLAEVVGKPSSKQNPRWKIAQGFMPDEQGKTLLPDSQNKPKYPWWSENHLFIPTIRKDLDFVLHKSDCQPIGKPYKQYYRTRDPYVFKGPMVLINQGFTKFVYVDFDVLFRSSLQSITGPKEDEELLIFLCLVLRSKFARYLMFHTVAYWGTERDKVLEYELLRLPFPLPERMPDSKKARSIVKEAVAQFRETENEVSKTQNFLVRKDLIRKADNAVYPLLCKYYSIDDFEKQLIADTCDIVIPSAVPQSLNKDVKALRTVSRNERKKYVDRICTVFSSWTKHSGWEISCETIVSPQTGLGIISLNKSHKAKPYVDIEADTELEAALTRIMSLLPRQQGHITYMRGAKVFDGDNIYIVKPLILRYWTQTAAMNDADELAAAILSFKGGNN